MEGVWDRGGRARMLPANLDHLRVQWRTRRSHGTASVTPGHDCLCSYAWGFWFAGQGRIHLVSMVCKKGRANGSEHKPVRQFRITYPLAQR